MDIETYGIRVHENANPTWKKIIVESNVPESLIPLRELSRNLWWVWNDEAKTLFSEVDPEIWEQSQYNPVVLLEETSLERFDELKSDESFILRMKSVESKFQKYLREREKLHGPKIAYFSMEYGLHSV
jgi:glucan phosphorylase